MISGLENSGLSLTRTEVDGEPNVSLKEPPPNSAAAQVGSIERHGQALLASTKRTHLR